LTEPMPGVGEAGWKPLFWNWRSNDADAKDCCRLAVPEENWCACGDLTPFILLAKAWIFEV
jgi:hypothetical protein